MIEEKVDVDDNPQSIELRILSSLSDHAAPVPVVTLAEITNVPLLRLGTTLRELKNAGLVEIGGPPGKEVAELVRTGG
jgi:DNA-binding IscR family transcriptional regulator